MAQPQISSINFGEQGVEIVYAEQADIDNMESTGVLRTRVVMCPIRHIETEYQELIDDAAQLLDKILLAERNPSSSFRR